MEQTLRIIGRVAVYGLLVLPSVLQLPYLGGGRRVRAREATALRLGLDSVDSAEIIGQRGGRVTPAWKERTPAPVA